MGRGGGGGGGGGGGECCPLLARDTNSGGGVGVLSASRPAIEDLNSKLYVRIIILTF